MQSDDELITFTRPCIQRSRSRTTFSKNALLRRRHTVLSIATKKCKFVKASASGSLCLHPRTRGCPAPRWRNHISRPSWLHQLYNTSRASCDVTLFSLILQLPLSSCFHNCPISFDLPKPARFSDVLEYTKSESESKATGLESESESESIGLESESESTGSEFESSGLESEYLKIWTQV